jgi:hypothetical protein
MKVLGKPFSKAKIRNCPKPQKAFSVKARKSQTNYDAFEFCKNYLVMAEKINFLAFNPKGK